MSPHRPPPSTRAAARSAPAPLRRALRQRWLRGLGLLWLWLMPLYGLQVYLGYRGHGGGVGLGEAYAIALQDALLWMALGPLVAWIWLHRRLHAVPAVSVALHALLAVAVALVHVLLDAALGVLLAALAGRTSGIGFLYFLLGQKLGLNLLLYALQLGWLAVAEAVIDHRVAAAGTGEAGEAQAADAGAPAVPVLSLRDGSRLVRVPVAAIRRIDAAGNYLGVQHGDRTEVARMTMAQAERALAGTGVVRVHRGTMLQLARIVELRPLAHGDAQAVLDDGALVRVSRTYRPALERRLGA